MNDAPDPARSVIVVQRNHDSRRWVGVVLIVVGALFFVDRLGWDMGWAWRPTFGQMWPILLIVVGLAQLASSGRDTVVTDKLGQETRTYRGRSVPGLWWVFLGVIMLLDQNRWLRLDQSWPLFIVAGGLSILLNRGRHLRRGL